MGGATSKLKENDWEKADGKLKSAQDTVDGSPPTTKYGIYHLTKRGVNQREFDITDSENNVLYTTRQVPGTIACFDLLGKEMNNYLIRVNVDIARRYWTLYRFEVATFENQKPDKEATERLVAQRLQEAQNDPRIEQFNTPFLFRKAVIIVSWSRYMAVACMCGPPTEELVMRWEAEKFASLQTSQQTSNSNNSEQHSTNTPVKEGLLYKPASWDKDDANHKTISTPKNNDVDTETNGNGNTNNDNDNEKNNMFQCSPTAQANALAVQLSDVSLGSSVEELSDVNDTNSAVAEGNIKVLGGGTAADVTVAELPYIRFDDNMGNEAPLDSKELLSNDDGTGGERHGQDGSGNGTHWLHCGPIDPSIPKPASERLADSVSTPSLKGNRERTQSEGKKMNLSDWAKEKSAHFRQQSRSALERSGVIDKIARRNPREGVLDPSNVLILCQEIYTRIIGNHQTSLISKSKALELLKQDIAQHEKEHPETALQDETEEDKEIMEAESQEVVLARTKSQDSGNGVPESKEVDPDDDDDDAAAADHSLTKKNEPTKDEKETVATVAGEKEQPLVGYWLWENTLRTHKMKMHVAKNSDLALHVIMAIIVNQVRYERNALALTV